MRHRTAGTFFRATVFAGALALAQAATAGLVILDHDEWTLSDFGFALAPVSTTSYAQNLASTMNSDGGACNLLVHSNNFGLTGGALNLALTFGAGCTVTYSLSPFSAASLSPYDGVLLAGNQTGYDANILASYVNAGGSVYIAGGTASITNEDSAWDSFTHQFGLDFGTSYNGIQGVLPISSSDPLFTGVTHLYYNNGNSVSVLGGDPESQILVSLGDQGLLGIYDGKPDLNPTADPNAIPEPATLALLGIGVFALGLRRRKPN